MKKINEMRVNKNKSVPVYFNGKKLCQMYPHATGWEVFKFKVKRFVRKVILTLTLFGVLAGVIAIVRYAYPMVVVQTVSEEVVIDNLGPKIAELKGGLIKDLWDNERAGHTEVDALVTIDPNPNHKEVEILSYGTCQFKIPTMQDDYFRYYGKKLTRQEAMKVAMSDNQCKEVMEKVVFGEKDGWSQWYNSGLKVNAKGRLAVIRELEK
jgi:hypothetical protein